MFLWCEGWGGWEADLLGSANAMPSMRVSSENREGTTHLSVSILNYAAKWNAWGLPESQGLPGYGAQMPHSGAFLSLNEGRSRDRTMSWRTPEPNRSGSRFGNIAAKNLLAGEAIYLLICKPTE
jgi:hypothetical protein